MVSSTETTQRVARRRRLALGGGSRWKVQRLEGLRKAGVHTNSRKQGKALKVQFHTVVISPLSKRAITRSIAQAARGKRKDRELEAVQTIRQALDKLRRRLFRDLGLCGYQVG